MKLEYENFKQELLEYIKDSIPNADISVESVITINRKKDGIVIAFKDNSKYTLSLPELYQNYLEFGNIEIVFNEVMQMIDKPICKIKDEFYLEWQEAKYNVQPIVINKEKNLHLAKQADWAYREVLDLIIIYYLKLPLSNGKLGCLKITNAHLSKWNITEEELYMQCHENADYIIHNLVDELLVLTSDTNNYSAAGIFFTEELRKLAERRQCDFYILPCSVNNVILVDTNCAYLQPERLKEIVNSMNDDKEVVTEEEYLSDSVYMYKRNDDKFVIVK